ncbi:hypothetical protein [Altererythrobacter lauratis]|uniref:Uncharacterized protein n=1 Tax=Alteraurantiacibacter lauratis TaxID=2054627 RepID=A0ABV7EH45_9SPHN
MVDVFLVVANGAAGKSATIRALTGARVRGAINVEIGTPRIVRPVWVEIRSLQEVSINEQIAVDNILNSGCGVAIIAMRYGQFRNCNPAQSYINAFETAGMTIRGVCEIGPIGPIATNPPMGAGFHQVVPVQGANTSANQRAAVLRSAWSIT